MKAGPLQCYLWSHAESFAAHAKCSAKPRIVCRPELVDGTDSSFALRPRCSSDCKMLIMHALGLIDRRSLHLTLAALVVESDALSHLRTAFQGEAFPSSSMEGENAVGRACDEGVSLVCLCMRACTHGCVYISFCTNLALRAIAKTHGQESSGCPFASLQRTWTL